MTHPIRFNYGDCDGDFNFNLAHIDYSHIHSPRTNFVAIDPIPQTYFLEQSTKNPTVATKSGMSKSDIARKAAITRKSHDPDAFRKMGSKGGKAKHKQKEEVVE